MDRKREIELAVADVREIEKRDGVTRESLEKIKQRLIRLAARKELFSASDFPPPAPGGKLKSSDSIQIPAHGDIREAR